MFILPSSTHTFQDAFAALKEDVSISVAGGRNNLIQLMEAEKGTHVDIAHPLPVWVLDRGDSTDTPASLDTASDVSAGVKRERGASDGNDVSVSCTPVDGDMVDSVGSDNPLDKLRRADPLKAIYFIGLSLKDECKVCKQGTPSPGAFFKCPIKGTAFALNFNLQFVTSSPALLEKKKGCEMPFEGPLADRPCVLCGKKYRSHELKILDLGIEFNKVCDKYTGQMSRRKSQMRGQNITISVKTCKEFGDFSWVKSSLGDYCRDLGEVKDGDFEDEELPQDVAQEPKKEPSQSPPPPAAGTAVGGSLQPVAVIDTVKEKDSVGNTVVFKLKPNQELRFEVKADSNQQARKATATLVLKQGGTAEICGAELAAEREYFHPPTLHPLAHL